MPDPWDGSASRLNERTITAGRCETLPEISSEFTTIGSNKGDWTSSERTTDRAEIVLGHRFEATSGLLRSTTLRLRKLGNLGMNKPDRQS